MNSNDIDQIINSERALAAAHQSLDLATIDGLLHRDYTILQPGGIVETKQEVLNSYRSGQRYWDSADVSALDVAVFGQTARVIGLWSAIGTNAGNPFNYQARFISIWIKEDGKWKNLAYYSVEILTK